MASLVERDAVAKVQDLADEFDNAKAFKFPFMSRVRKGKAPMNAKMTYAVEKYDDPKITGAVDEADPEDFENPSDGDAELDVRVHVWERAVRIGGLATTVTHQSGITPRNVVAKKVAKKLLELKRDAEVTSLSDNESQIDNGVVGNETRGLVKWASATAQSHYPVPTAFLTPSASIDTTAVADYVDSTITAVAQSQYDETGDETEENVLFAGSTWKRGLDRITFYAKTESNRTIVRQFNQSSPNRVSLGKVDMLETSFSDIEVQLLQHVNASGDPTSAASKRLAVGGPLENMEIRWADAPNMIPLAKTGRPTKFLVTATGALVVHNPKKLIKFVPSA